jgi:hypothetical protein
MSVAAMDMIGDLAGKRRSAMSNSTQYVKKLAVSQPTRDDKGLEMTIRIVAYDNGIVNVNGNPVGPDACSNPMLSASRFVTQLVEQLEADVSKRRTRAAA